MTTDRDAFTAAGRFREAVGKRDVAAMIDTMSPDIELHSPTMLRPVTDRERVRAVFHISQRACPGLRICQVLRRRYDHRRP
jgi:hypothetical protein